MVALSFMIAHYQEILADFSLMASGAYALAVLVPGEYPDKWIESFLNFTKGISRK